MPAETMEYERLTLEGLEHHRLMPNIRASMFSGLLLLESFLLQFDVWISVERQVDVSC